VIDINILLGRATARVKSKPFPQINVKGSGFFVGRVGSKTASITFIEDTVKPVKPEVRLFKSVTVMGYGDIASVIKRPGGSAVELKSDYFHVVAETQDHFIKSQVRRIVKGL